jgi:hypothetical protein
MYPTSNLSLSLSLSSTYCSWNDSFWMENSAAFALNTNIANKCHIYRIPIYMASFKNSRTFCVLNSKWDGSNGWPLYLCLSLPFFFSSWVMLYAKWKIFVCWFIIHKNLENLTFRSRVTLIGSCFETDWSFLFHFSTIFEEVFLTFWRFAFWLKNLRFPNQPRLWIASINVQKHNSNAILSKLIHAHRETRNLVYTQKYHDFWFKVVKRLRMMLINICLYV